MEVQYHHYGCYDFDHLFPSVCPTIPDQTKLISRYFVFTFHESPKFLLSRGREQEAIDVLHKIAKYNKQPRPTLTVEHFRELEQAETTLSGTTLNAELDPVEEEIMSTAAHAKQVTRRALSSITHLKALFTNKLQCFIFILFALAYAGGEFIPSCVRQGAN